MCDFQIDGGAAKTVRARRLEQRERAALGVKP
jgi:hypothetical protein